jgi:NAD(P)H-flavin reductase/ferredoxin
VADARYPVEITTSDGVRLKLEVPDGSSVVEAAAADGLILPSQCGQGTCGTCHATARGAYRLGPHSPAALPPEQEAIGGVLLCRTYPLGSVDVQVGYARSRIIEGGIAQREGTVISVAPVARDTVWLRLQLAPDDAAGAGVEFEPGQFMELQLPGDERRRAYSLANTANWDGEVEFLVRLHPGGYFSEFLRRARPGDPVVAHGPLGAFGLRESGMRPRWFVAGGTGLAPVMSMLRRMAEWGEPQPARLFLGVTEPVDRPELSALEELSAQLPRFELDVCAWRPDDAWTGPVGTPADLLAKALAAGGSAPDVYVCGPPALVDAVQRVGREAGLPEEQVVTERLLPT